LNVDKVIDVRFYYKHGVNYEMELLNIISHEVILKEPIRYGLSEYDFKKISGDSIKGDLNITPK